ncbi:MAG TPA: hypothetical protein VF637_19000 [Sphingomicrobium sp.]
MRKPAIAAAVVATLLSVPLMAKKAPKAVWQVTRTSDPITGTTTCIVAADDRAAGMSYTRVGGLYPFVENSGTHGLLVGISSGGRIRLPTGDILWRVDDRPFRKLAAADNPAAMNTPAVPQSNAATAQLIDQQMRLIAAATATSTVASGETARSILAEMLAGSGLVFRGVAATASYGLPTGADQRVGQITK